MTQSLESGYRFPFISDEWQKKGMDGNCRFDVLKLTGKAGRAYENPANCLFSYAKGISCDINGLQTEFRSDYIVIGAAGGETGASLIFHNKKVTAVEMTMHFPDPFLINNIRFVNAVKL